MLISNQFKFPSDPHTDWAHTITVSINTNTGSYIASSLCHSHVTWPALTCTLSHPSSLYIPCDPMGVTLDFGFSLGVPRCVGVSKTVLTVCHTLHLTNAPQTSVYYKSVKKKGTCMSGTVRSGSSYMNTFCLTRRLVLLFYFYIRHRHWRHYLIAG